MPQANQEQGETLRERKRRQTRQRIADAAMSLFLERGFDAATVEDIAAAADVSKRSFFDYFPTKEDVVAAWQDEFGAVLCAAIAARPPQEPMATAVQTALIESVSAMTDQRNLAIAELICATPALKARDHLKYARLEDQLAAALLAREGSGGDAFRARLFAMLTVGALRVAGETWREREDKPPLGDFARETFQTMLDELSRLGTDAA
jgi:AcrR family transcriptional regulator